MSRIPAHIYAVQPPNEHCPPGFSYACWCSHCGETRGLHVPASIKDFTRQMEAFGETHKRCRPRGGAEQIRHAMKQGSIERMSGTVECDETWVGGKSKNMHATRRREMRAKGFPKVCVMGFKERGGDVRLTVVANTKAETLQPTIREYVQEGATLYSDNARGYNGIGESYNHETVNHLVGQYVDGDVTTNRIENVWTHLKRSYGTHIHYSPQHAQRYATEHEFKVNYRDQKDGGRFAILVASISGKRLGYRELVESGLSRMAE